MFSPDLTAVTTPADIFTLFDVTTILDAALVILAAGVMWKVITFAYAKVSGMISSRARL